MTLLEYFKGDGLAADVWQNKYAQPGDKTPDDMHRRMAREFAKIEEKYRTGPCAGHSIDKTILSKYGQNREFLSEQKIYDFFKEFRYFIPQGSVMSGLGSKQIASLSNCFVIGQPEDSYGGIFQKDEQMVQLMKRRGGVGLDISTLRPSGTNVSNAAKSSTGAISFMHRYSNSTREVAQGGRRGALMLSISISHPDVMEFIKIKRDLTQVTGANISIKLNNKFMKAVENNEDYILQFPCNFNRFQVVYPETMFYNELIEIKTAQKDVPILYLKRIKAREYWDEIITSARTCAEPGLMFEDEHINNSPDGLYNEYRGVTTNPCGEIFMQPYDSCRLLVNRLDSYVKNQFTKEAYFDFEQFYEYNYEAMRLADDLIDLELEYVDRIIAKINADEQDEDVKRVELELWYKIRETGMSSRRAGLGITALGDTLACLNLKYDSDEAIKMIDKIFYTKMQSELDCTIDIAITRGTFKGWNPLLEYGNNSELINIDSVEEFIKVDISEINDYYLHLIKTFPEQALRMYKYGRRNVSFSTCAPTGSVSLLANNCTGGIEPLFAPYYFRRKKVNPNEKDVRIDFVDQNGDSWTEYAVLHPKFKEWIVYTLKRDLKTDIEFNVDDLTKSTLEDLFKASPYFNSTANDIDWKKRVEIQSVIQKYISHSISSTINLPSSVTNEDVSEIYMEAWKQHLKGVTVNKMPL